MSRLVEPTEGTYRVRLAAQPKAEDYLERVVKYIPIEIVAAYTAFCGLASQVGESLRLGVIIGFFVLCVALTPVYLARLGKNLSHRAVQLTVSTVAFVVWAYALGGSGGFFGPDGIGGYDGTLASILLIAFTLISSVIVPKGDAKQ